MFTELKQVLEEMVTTWVKSNPVDKGASDKAKKEVLGLLSLISSTNFNSLIGKEEFKDYCGKLDSNPFFKHLHAIVQFKTYEIWGTGLTAETVNKLIPYVRIWWDVDSLESTGTTDRFIAAKLMENNGKVITAMFVYPFTVYLIKKIQ